MQATVGSRRTVRIDRGIGFPAAGLIPFLFANQTHRLIAGAFVSAFPIIRLVAHDTSDDLSLGVGVDLGAARIVSVADPASFFVGEER